MPAAVVRVSANSPQTPAGATTRLRRRTLITLGGVLLCLCVIGGQLVRLALRSGPEIKVALAEPLARSWSRPDIVDRNGRLLASDIAVNSLYADPQLILDLDEAIERLAATLPGLDEAELRKSLADRSRRFAWVARGLSPRQAQSVHDLGLPGLAFRVELKRAYPLSALAGHLLGTVNTDNKGLAGIERLLDDTGRVEGVQGPGRMQTQPLRLSIDIGVQHGLAEELKLSASRYSAPAAAGLVLEANSGEILAAVSLPEVDPSRPGDWLDATRSDRLAGGIYELGSIFKTMTIAMALEAGTASLDKLYDVRQPLLAGTYTIKDPYPQGRPLSVRDIFLHSSNVGAGMLALDAGPERQRSFLARLGLTEPMRTEAGPVAPPLLPKHWGTTETVTIGYGHGLALAPLQFAGALATLVNGGTKVAPTLLARNADKGEQPAHRLGRHQRPHQGDHAPQRHAPLGHRPPRRRRGLPRRRQDRHGRDAGTRRLSGESGDLLLHRRLPDGCPQIRSVRAALPAADRRDRRRPHHGRPQRRTRHRTHRRAHRSPSRRPTPPRSRRPVAIGQV